MAKNSLTKQLVESAAQNRPLDMTRTFSKILQGKISTILEQKRVDIAETLIKGKTEEVS